MRRTTASQTTTRPTEKYSPATTAKASPRQCYRDRRHRVPDEPTESWRRFMADKVKVWFDAEADYLEVRFNDEAGYMRETKHDAVMERIDAQGHVTGFSILGVSQFKKDKPLEAELTSA